jgi:hypothetical protein
MAGSIKRDVQRLSNLALLLCVRGGKCCLGDRGGLRARSHINVQDRLTLGLSKQGDYVPEGASFLSSSVHVTGVGWETRLDQPGVRRDTMVRLLLHRNYDFPYCVDSGMAA